MESRRPIPESVQAEVLVQCRRRCCVCFGLNRDETIKKGQIAHLDQRRSNVAIENLVFLCFDHHDEFDSTTSQAKGLTRAEVARYRTELLARYSSWQSSSSTSELLNFLAFQVDGYALAKAAVDAARRTVFYGESHAFDVLITNEVDYSDGDLYMPHILALDYYTAWGWLTYTSEEREINPDEGPRVFIKTERKPICDDVAATILDRAKQRPDDYARLLHIATFRGWEPPKRDGLPPSRLADG